VPESDRHRAEAEDFSAAILENRAPQFGLAETLRNAEVLDRLFAASRRVLGRVGPVGPTRVTIGGRFRPRGPG